MATATEVERRAKRRFSLKLPVAVEGQNGLIPAETRDISSNGVCFYIDSPVATGSNLEFTLTLPPEITLTGPVQLHCGGRVVRVEGRDPQGRMAVAAAIENYEFLSEV